MVMNSGYILFQGQGYLALIRLPVKISVASGNESNSCCLLSVFWCNHIHHFPSLSITILKTIRDIYMEWNRWNGLYQYTRRCRRTPDKSGVFVIVVFLNRKLRQRGTKFKQFLCKNETQLEEAHAPT